MARVKTRKTRKTRTRVGKRSAKKSQKVQKTRNGRKRPRGRSTSKMPKLAQALRDAIQRAGSGTEVI